LIFLAIVAMLSGIRVSSGADVMAGRIIWYELMSANADASRAFYSAVLAWEIDARPTGDMDYRMIAAPDGLVGGLFGLPAVALENGAQPGWVFYVSVDDLDGAIGRIESAGGGLIMPPSEIPGTGRFAFVTDPQGAPFYIMTPQGEGGASMAHHQGMPGHGGWHELHSSDGAAAFAFYASQFGWQPDGDMDMGPDGLYRLFKIGDVQSGGIYTDSHAPHPYWATYFQVADIDVSASRITAAGGTVLRGPMEVPGGSWVINATDPQGVGFSVVGPKIA